MRALVLLILATILDYSVADPNCSSINDVCLDRVSCDVACDRTPGQNFESSQLDLTFPSLSLPECGQNVSTELSYVVTGLNGDATLLALDIPTSVMCTEFCFRASVSLTGRMSVRLSGAYLQQTDVCTGGFIDVNGPVIHDNRIPYSPDDVDTCGLTVQASELAGGRQLLILINMDNDAQSSVGRTNTATVSVRCMDVVSSAGG
eukprot:755295_1